MCQNSISYKCFIVAGWKLQPLWFGCIWSILVPVEKKLTVGDYGLFNSVVLPGRSLELDRGL